VWVWIQFAVCTGLIVFSGARLSRYGDAIAEMTGMGRTWVGVVLMAAATSLPELVTGISSSAVYDLPNIAAGDVLGSCAVNLVILAFLDIGRKASPISSVAHQGQVLSAAFGILLLAIASITIVTPGSMARVGWFGVTSVILLVLYAVAMKLVFAYEKKRIAEYLGERAEQQPSKREFSARSIYGHFAFHAFIVMAAATYLPLLASDLAERTGLGTTYVGSMFVAVSTSLPEVVVSREALKLGAVDLAVGNVLGSNLFNMAILALDDFFYLPGPILTSVSPTHAVTAMAAITMTAIMIVSLIYRSRHRVLLFPWSSVGILAVYGILSVLLYQGR
jgi:cation:H+ antiporter